ncbi:MAG: urea carboxylase-associated family protein, partial [Candidatus Tectomicrobia bacterium]|nr:urea carboxylase-associated family protein [Candidatus Tectomicrobia bacterium]
MSEKVVYSLPKLDPERQRYHKRLVEDPSTRKKVQDFVIPKETGEAFVVRKGQVLRVIDVEGPQVADFNAFSQDNPREMFWSGRTRLLQGGHLTVGHQLWSTPPKMRPMFTLIADTVEHKPLPHGARSHDLLYSRCNERLFEVLTGEKGRPNCQDN